MAILTGVPGTVIVVVIFGVLVGLLVAASKRVTARLERERRACDEFVQRTLAFDYERQVHLAKLPPHTNVPLEEGEVLIYAGSTSRTYNAGYTNRTTRSVTQTTGRTGEAIVGAVLAGPAGAIIGAAGGRESITVHGPPVTEAVRVSDNGELVITDRRVLFIGERQIVEIARAGLLGITVACTPPTVTPGRLYYEAPVITPGFGTLRFRRAEEPANENYRVQDIVALALVLSGAGIAVPVPPPPLTFPISR